MDNMIFLSKGSIQGIIRIENMLTGKLFLVKSMDVVRDSRTIRFKLDMGDFECKELQKDYEETGLELFDINLDAELKDPYTLDELLEKRKEYYLRNSVKLYQQE